MQDESFRISRADDRACITALIHRYAYLARELLDFDDMLPLFTNNAIIVMSNGEKIPANQLKKVLRGEEAKFIRHHVTTVDIRFDGPNDAHGQAFFIAGTNEAMPDHWGHWSDKYKRQNDGAWLICKRQIVSHGQSASGWRARMYG